MDALTRQVADLLHKVEVGYPEVTVGEERRAATGPTHLLREEGAGRVGAHAGGEAEGDVLDLPMTVNGAESGTRSA
jgi:hypothetical protein